MRRPATSSELTMITSLASLSFSVSVVVQNMAGLLVRGHLPWVTAHPVRNTIKPCHLRLSSGVEEAPPILGTDPSPTTAGRRRADAQLPNPCHDQFGWRYLNFYERDCRAGSVASWETAIALVLDICSLPHYSEAFSKDMDSAYRSNLRNESGPIAMHRCSVRYDAPEHAGSVQLV